MMKDSEGGVYAWQIGLKKEKRKVVQRQFVTLPPGQGRGPHGG
jgi:hypothetical protein